VDYERKKVAKKERVIIVVCLLKLLISKSKGPNNLVKHLPKHLFADC